MERENAKNQIRECLREFQKWYPRKGKKVMERYLAHEDEYLGQILEIAQNPRRVSIRLGLAEDEGKRFYTYVYSAGAHPALIVPRAGRTEWTLRIRKTGLDGVDIVLPRERME